MPLIENTTKQKLKRNELALGFGVHHLRTAGTAMLAAAANHDWLFIDMEHGAISGQRRHKSASRRCRPASCRSCASAAGEFAEGTRALDNGALGLVVPHVDTA